MSQVEEMLIARASPIMHVYRKHGGQRGYKGHVLNLPQDIEGFLDRLPCNVHELPVLLLRCSGDDNTHTDLRVRRDKVLAALQWLVANNPFYANITIDLASVQQLPQDGIPDELLQAVVSDEEDSNPTEDSGEAAIACIAATRSFHYQSKQLLKMMLCVLLLLEGTQLIGPTLVTRQSMSSELQVLLHRLFQPYFLMVLVIPHVLGANVQ